MKTTAETKHTVKQLLDVVCNGTRPELIKLIGYTGGNRDYDIAKKPKGKNWQFLSIAEAKEWSKQGGYIGLRIPAGHILIDIDDRHIGEILYKGLLRAGAKFIALKTPHGSQFIFQDIGRVATQRIKTVVAGGIVADYRLSGKGYTVLPAKNTEGREIVHISEELSPMPLFFLSVRTYKKQFDNDNLMPVPIVKGQRNSVIFSHACRLREWNVAHMLKLSAGEQEQIIRQVNALLCDEPLSDNEVEKCIRNAERYDGSSHRESYSESSAAPEEWPEIILLDSYTSLPDFPVDALPKPAREMVEAVARVNQVDSSLPAGIALSNYATALQKKILIDLISHRETVSMFHALVYDSGERKSGTMAQMTAPIYEHQSDLQLEMKDDVREAHAQFKTKEQRLAEAMRRAARCDNPHERRGFEAQISELSRELDRDNLPHLPILIMDDATQESLAVHMAQQHGKMAIYSTEGGVFGMMNGRYSDKLNLDIYLKSYSGDPISVHRIGREPLTILRPALVMCLTVQPDVIREIGETRQFRGRGLTARFLFTICRPQAGFRQIENGQTSAITDEIRDGYNDHLRRLLELKAEERILRLRPDAQELWTGFYNDVETSLRPGEPLEHLKDWGSKLPGAAARIAGLLHVAEGQGLDSDITVQTVERACLIAAFYQKHALAAFGQMKERPEIESARKILGYIERQRPESFKAREVFRLTSGFTSIKEINEGLQVLEERGYIRRIVGQKPGEKGGRPEADSYLVSPKLRF